MGGFGGLGRSISRVSGRNESEGGGGLPFSLNEREGAPFPVGIGGAIRQRVS